MLVIAVVDTESYDSWLAFLRGVRARGASSVRFVVSDAHRGLVHALGDVFQGATWQRCVVRLIRDCAREAGSWAARRHVPRGPRHAARGVPQGRRRAGGGGARRPGVPRLPAVALEEAQDQQRPGAANREIKRRSRMAQVFPSMASLIRLAGAAMCDLDEAWASSRYFSEVRMRELPGPGEAPAGRPAPSGADLESVKRVIEASLELADKVEDR